MTKTQKYGGKNPREEYAPNGGCPAPDLKTLRAIVSEWSPDTPATRTARWVRYARHRINLRSSNLPNQEGPFASGTPPGFSFQAESRRKNGTGSRSADVTAPVTPTAGGPVVSNIVPVIVPIAEPPAVNRQVSNGREAVDDYFGIAEFVERVGTVGSNAVAIHVEDIGLCGSDGSIEESGPRRDPSSPAATGRVGYSANFTWLLCLSSATTAELARSRDSTPADDSKVGHGARLPPLERCGKLTPQSVVLQRPAEPKRSRLPGRYRRFKALEPVCIYCTLDNGRADYGGYPRGCLPERPAPCCERASKKLEFLHSALYSHWRVTALYPEDFVVQGSSDAEGPGPDSMGLYPLYRCPHLTPQVRELQEPVARDERRSNSQFRESEEPTRDESRSRSQFYKECWTRIRCRCGGVIQDLRKRVSKTHKHKQQNETFHERVRRQRVEEGYMFFPRLS